MAYTITRRNSARVLITIVGNFIVTMVTYLWKNITYNSRVAWYTVYSVQYMVYSIQYTYNSRGAWHTVYAILILHHK